MEGQFSRVSKGHRHPHTNMAKAALNMLTRTAGLEYQMDGIYMTAADTGWVTDKRPFRQAAHEAETKGFAPPLDCKDGAARVYHPILEGIIDEEKKPFLAVFLKDFKVHPW
jgi:NAD(P)-dependent dehydrogenase (short-subunit alcohol dehydrogenase family)